MKKTFLFLGIVTLSLTACKTNFSGIEESNRTDSLAIQLSEDNAKNSLDYVGTYKGSFPCADCEAILTTIIINKNSYSKEIIYKGKSSKVLKETGKYSWNAVGNTITLLGSEVPNQYFVGENVLFQFDTEGKRIQGNLASKYQLSKIQTSDEIVLDQKEETKNDEVAKVDLKDSKWRLVKLNGKTIKKNKDNKREYGISFSDTGRFSVFVGCNNMMGSYNLKEEVSRIEFSKVASTMMACENMELEKEFAQVLETVDNYNFDGKTLKLNKARMAPLAEFEIIK
ncbi:META domain-containing protein [Flavobacterium luminosum]|uniref:META domain-containing protein n=1 Tax=Flavobacterium luminosum TaxID=2949086 RepID=A0ABT0TLW5_9FLAO|nr:META domain-containing protein [Flavobacterium sp. HXWNR70]MCL9808482.1 META domain-containing protein [Flavobacterium sp. HXWNR70]